MMKLIHEFSDATLGIGPAEHFDKPYKLRKAARVILFNDQKKIAFQHISKRGHYKLPGGGVEEGESVEEALKREVLEEVGYNCEILEEVGMTLEYRNEGSILQISYCYTARVIGKNGEPVLDEGEKEIGLIPVWVTLEEAIELLKESKPTDYVGVFIVARDLALLQTCASSI